jgi:isopentenyl diphosphate isomerase/L-lactate dehydrogenase-like FMN-dependent dehydrogenase
MSDHGNPYSMPQTILTIEDLRLLAKRRVPRMFYDYVDSGSWTESTCRANSEDFEGIKLRQRVAVDISARTLASTMVGQPVAMPVALAPTGLTGMQHADGEILAARAAAKAGVPFTLSTMSICSIEDVAHAHRPPILVPAGTRSSAAQTSAKGEVDAPDRCRATARARSTTPALEARQSASLS